VLNFSPPPEAPCQIEGLLLKVADLPGNGWEESGSRSYKGAPITVGVERIGTSFVGYGLFDGILHTIYRLTDEESANRAYVDFEERDFSVLDYLEEWKLPSELSHVQFSANSHRLGCNIYRDSGAEECNLLAQYGPYLVQFNIRQHGLQYSKIVPVFEEINKRMAKCISTK
jgi:hypothetical protein